MIDDNTIDKSMTLATFVNNISGMVNEEFDKSLTVTGRTTEGEPLQVAHFKVTQLGLREVMETSTGEEFTCSDDEIYGVLKN